MNQFTYIGMTRNPDYVTRIFHVYNMLHPAFRRPHPCIGSGMHNGVAAPGRVSQCRDIIQTG